MCKRLWPLLWVTPIVHSEHAFEGCNVFIDVKAEYFESARKLSLQNCHRTSKVLLYVRFLRGSVHIGQCSKVGIPKSGHTVKKWAHHFFQLNTKNEYQQRLKELHHVGDLSLTISGSSHTTFLVGFHPSQCNFKQFF